MILCGSAGDSEAQLRVHGTLSLNGMPARIESVFTPEMGAWYEAIVQGHELRMGSKAIKWAPSISCQGQHPTNGAQVCRVQAGRNLIWYIYGATTEQADPGIYHGHARLTVRGAGHLYTTSIPVRLSVRAIEPHCEISQSGALDFGEAQANTTGLVSLHSVTGQRSAHGYALQKTTSTRHRFARLTLSTSATSVMVSIDAPSVLRSEGSIVGFMSQLSYKSALSPTYRPLIEGSGSRRIQSDGPRLFFRLGGIVQTYVTSLEAEYQGNISFTILCEQS